MNKRNKPLSVSYVILVHLPCEHSQGPSTPLESTEVDQDTCNGLLIMRFLCFHIPV